jgi:LysR family transcriptional regulator, regulator for metE and metH
MLELRHLKTLIAIVEAGNISMAAKRLHLTQSAVSHQIRALEDIYETELFERKSHPLRLTPTGERLVKLAHETLRNVQDAERDLARISQGEAGNLRIAVECHSCFDWLMPSMDQFREHWNEVELDLVSGFHSDPLGLLGENKADLVIVQRQTKRKDVAYHPLFRFEILGLMAKSHPLTSKSHLTARDFEKETIITYPVPDEMLDLVREVLVPAKIAPRRRTATLTVAILQLVASRRGVAALPEWTVQTYLDREYLAAKPIGKKGLWSNLYAATTASMAKVAYIQDFVRTIRENSFRKLRNIIPVE